MKSISKTAIAAVLALGVTAGAPAFAQKKDEKAAAQPAIKMSKEARAAQAEVVNTFNTVVIPANQAFVAAKTPENKAALVAALQSMDPKLAAFEAIAKTPDEQYVAGSLRYTKERALVATQNDGNAKAQQAGMATVAPVLDRLLANPSVPAKAQGEYAYDRAWIALNQRQFQVASANFEKALANGYNDPQLRLQIARSKIDGGDVPGGITALNAEIEALKAAGKPVPADYYTLAINRLYTAKSPEAIVWTQRWLSAYPTQKNWHDAIMTFGFAGKNPRAVSDTERLDLYRLLDTAGALADENEYFLYADAALKAGVPYETQTVLKTGVSKGKVKTTATNYIDLNAGAQKAIREDTPLAQLDTRARSAPNGELALQTGDGYLGQGNNAKAVELYKVAQSKGVKDADGLMTRLGIAQLRSGDKAGAKASFQAVTGTRKDVATLWLTYLEQPAVAG